MTASGQDLDAILRTIREVEDSLERRSARAGAVVMITWGVVAAAIFTFYGFVDRDPSIAERLGEGLVRWAWVAPIVLGYILTTLAQVRLGRMRAEQGSRNLRRFLAILLVPIALLTLILLTGFGWQLIPAMWVAFLGYATLTWHEGPSSVAARAIAFASFALAAVLALPPLWEWGNFAAALWYAGFLAAHGVVRYHAA